MTNPRTFHDAVIEAQRLADASGQPYMVTHLGGYRVVAASRYTAAEHGCCEKVLSPAGYKGPTAVDVLSKGRAPW